MLTGETQSRKVLLAVVGVLAIGAGIAVLAQDQGQKTEQAPPAAVPGNDYTRSVAKPYDEVMKAVEVAAKAQGFRVSNVHDIAASLRKDGIERKPVATVEVCNSKLAAQVLQAEPRLATLMPCRIAVFEKDGQTVVSMIWPSRLMTMFPENAEVKDAAAQVDKSMKAIVDQATQ